MSFPELQDRPIKETICLFDVDGTLTPARQSASPEMLKLLLQLREKCAIGFVGGSDLVKQQEQLGTPSVPVTSLFDFCFAENGLTAYRLGQPLESTSFLKHLGESNYQKLAKFVLRYISELEGLPAMRGTFIEKQISGIDYKHIHFFGDKSFKGGNDYEIYSDERTIGHAVKGPEDTMKILRETFGL